MSSSQTASRHQAGSDFQPYIGLRPFTEQEKDRFFGRSNEASILLDKIRANRLTLLLAASGVGKSSLLQAGIMPELRTDSNIELIYYNVWSASPQAFKQAVSEHYGEPYKDVSLKSILRACTLFSSGQLILLLDQFEELFNYHRFKAEFQPFIEELSAAVLDRSLPVSFVFSMREDFALELNSFKDSLPGVFDNYFRLEKLTCEQAREAIEKPLEGTGYCFAPKTENQEALLDQVLHDLAKREQERQFGVQELLELKELPLLVEPPHLQIVCRELWERHRDEKVRQLTYAAYEKAGRTAGILNSYFLGKIDLFSKQEQALASAAFDHLIGQRSTKIAHSLERLAELARADAEDLQSVLDRLQNYAILRRQKRGEEFWYELYHDIFSESIDSWNRYFKARQRMKRFSCGAFAALFAGCVLFAGNNWRANYYGRYLQLSPKVDVSDRIEVYQGTLTGWDIFHQRHFCFESPFLREELEADKRFSRGLIEDKENGRTNLVGSLPIIDRLPRYAENGLYSKVDELAQALLKTGEQNIIKSLPVQLASIRTEKSIGLLFQVAERQKDTNVVTAIAQLSDSSSLVKLLANGPANVRRAVIVALRILGDSSVAPELAKLLVDENADVRFKAAEALGRLGDSSGFVKLLEDEGVVRDGYSGPEVPVRLKAAEALGRLGDSSGFLKLLADEGVVRDGYSGPEVPVRLKAAEALGRLGDSSGFLKLLANEGVVRGKKVLVRGRYDRSEVPVRLKAAEALGRWGDSSARPELAKLLADENADVRLKAAEALGILGDSSAAPELAKLLANENADVRLKAAENLARRGDSSVAPELAKLLANENAGVRLEAAEALGILGDSSGFVKLLMDEGVVRDRYDRSEVPVRLKAAEALNRLGDSSGLVKLLADEGVMRDRYDRSEVPVRLEAAEALSILDDNSGFVKLLMDEGVMRDRYNRSEVPVRLKAAEALGRLGDSSVTPELANLLADENADVRLEAAEALRELGDSSGFVKLLADENADVRLKAVKVYILGDSSVAPELAKLLADENADVRLEAVVALGRLGDSSAAPVLIKLMEDENEFVQRSATVALGRLGDISVAPMLVRLLEDASMRNSAVSSLGRLGDSSVMPVLVKLLVDAYAPMRSSAVEALGRLKAEIAAPMVKRYLKNQDLKDATANTLISMNVSTPELRTWQEEQFKTAQVNLKKNKKQEAAVTLGSLFTEESVTLLSNLLMDGKQNVVKAAVESLGRIGEYHPALVQAQAAQLLKLTAHDNLNVRRTAITSLGQLISFYGKEAPAELSELEKKVHAALRNTLFDPQQNLTTRFAALDALGATGRPECAKEIDELLITLDQEKDESFRYRSCLWLGRMAYTPAAKHIEEELKKLEDEKANWRKQRDSEEVERDSSDELKQQDKTWKKEHWEYMLGNALARIKPETTGINLLKHPLYKVRQGAIRALASRIADGAADATLIGKIIQAHQNFDPEDLPSPFPYAAFRAIDLALWNLEYTGKKDDVSKLKDILKNLKPCQVPGQEGAIKERLEWTIERLDENLTKNAELAVAE